MAMQSLHVIICLDSVRMEALANRDVPGWLAKSQECGYHPVRKANPGTTASLLNSTRPKGFLPLFSYPCLFSSCSSQPMSSAFNRKLCLAERWLLNGSLKGLECAPAPRPEESVQINTVPVKVVVPFRLFRLSRQTWVCRHWTGERKWTAATMSRRAKEIFHHLSSTMQHKWFYSGPRHRQVVVQLFTCRRQREDEIGSRW